MTDQNPLYDADRHAHILARARDLGRALTRDLDHVLDLGRGYALTRDFDLAHARDHAHSLAHAHDVAHALRDARDVAHALDLALDLGYAHDLDYDLAPDLALALDLRPDLILDLRPDLLYQALDRINAFIEQWERLDALAEQPLTVGEKEEPAPVARSAERLVDVVMRLLPARHRGRYAEEFKAELYGLAQAKATATVQVVYALQQLGCVWQTRESLLRPDLPRFHRLHRAARWVLASEARTWTPLTGLLLWGGVETTLDTGPGTAILLAAGSGAVLQAGVTWGRNRLGVTVPRRKSAKQPDPPVGR